MLYQIQSLLAPPIFSEDELQTRRAETLNVFLLLLAFSSCLNVLANVLAVGTRPPVLAANLLMAVSALILRRYMRTGQLSRIYHIATVLYLLYITFIVAQLGTVRAPAAGAYILVVVATGVIVERRSLLITTTVCSLLVLGLVLAQNAGLLPEPDNNVSLTQWLTYTELMALGGLLAYMGLRSMRYALARANREIGERKVAQEQLRASEIRFRSLVQELNAGISRLDAQGHFVFANPMTERIFGRETEQLRGHRLSEFVIPEDRALFEQQFAARRNGANGNYRMHIRHSDGELRTLNVTAAPQFDAAGEFAGSLAALLDVTAQVQAQELVHRYEMLSEQTRDIILFVRARDGVILEANRAACEAYGYTRAELLGKNMSDLRATTAAETDAAQNGHAEHNDTLYVTAHRRRDGTTLPVEISARSVELDSTRVTLSVIRDISERIRSEEALRENQEKFSKAFQYAPLLMTISNVSDGRYIDVNDEYVRISGFSAAECIGKTSIELGWISAQDRALIADKLRQEGRVQATELTLCAKDKHSVTCLYHGELINIGGQAQLLSIALDITGRKRAERNLELLAQAGRELGATLNLTDIYATLKRIIESAMNCDYLFVSEFERPAEMIHCLYGNGPQGEFDVSEFPPIPLEPEGKGTQSLVIRSGEPGLYNDYAVRVQSANTSFYVDEDGTIEKELPEDEQAPQSAIIVPLKLEGQVVGAIQVLSIRKNEYVPADLQFLESLALHVSTAMENARLFARVQDELAERRRAEEVLQIQRDLGLRLGSVFDLSQALQAVLEAACRVEGIDSGGIYLFENNGALRLAAHRGLSRAFIVQNKLFPPDAPRLLSLRAGKPLYLNADHPSIANDALYQSEGGLSLAILPVLHESQPIAVLNLGSHSRNEIPQTVRSFLETLVPPIGSIIARLHAEAALRESQTKNTALLNALPDLMFRLDANGTFLDYHAADEQALALPPQVFMGRNVHEVLPPTMAELTMRHLDEIFDRGGTQVFEYTMERNGENRAYEARMVPCGLDSAVTIVRDMTERKRAAEEKEKLAALVESTPEFIGLASLDGHLEYLNQGGRALIGWEPADVTPLNLHELVAPDSFGFLTALQEITRTGHWQGEGELVHFQTGTRLPVQTQLFSIPHPQTHAPMALGTVMLDIRERKIHEAEIGRYTNQIVAQYSLARTLAEAESLETILEAVTRTAAELLNVTFARLALVEHNDLVIRAVYPLRDIRYDLQLGQREPLDILERCDPTDPLHRINILYAEEVRAQANACERLFVGKQNSLIVIPLRVSEQLLGYLLLGEERDVQREPFDDAKKRIGHSLANQAAGAIHRAQLRAQTRADAVELENAYAATIEGWSYALDLRDKETEGHTLRVTEMTLRLARAFGLSEEQLAHVRRGALLHDIGKMGIPDAILLKPGTLTGEEWEIMRRHPDYARMLLEPIHYLQPALAIPYCHHERWDGTGYPRGLKGDEIPLEARLFAVVDVWDALSSNRPYRAALPPERVLEYLRKQSGTHFDPQVVEVFLKFLEHNG